MHTFLSYKQTGIPIEILKKELNLIKNIIEKKGNSIYIYYFDEIENESPELLINKLKNEINKSDLVIGFINYAEKSEGELLELGLAKGLGKKIILIVNNKVKANYSLIYGLTKDILYYDDISELEELLTNYLKGK